LHACPTADFECIASPVPRRAPIARLVEDCPIGMRSHMSNASKTNDWTKPAAMAIPEGGFFPDKVEQGRYGPIFPKTPAC
jgi:hypothetical protein